MNAKTILNLAILAALTVMGSGCVTAKVWEPHQFARFHEPAEPANLQLFYSNERQDILVRYDEIIDTSGKIKPRAYWLERNGTKEGTEKRPSFVSIKHAQGLRSVPLLSSIEKNALESGGLFAVSTNGISFCLYSAPDKAQAAVLTTATLVGEFELPTYYDSLGPVKQVLRTPPALVADSVIAAGWVAVLGAPYWWPMLNCVVH